MYENKFKNLKNMLKILVSLFLYFTIISSTGIKMLYIVSEFYDFISKKN